LPAYTQVTAFFGALLAGGLAFVAMLAISGEHSWATEALVGIVVAAVWMASGAWLSRSHPVTCALLLVVGSVVARYLSYGMLFDAPLYGGITTYAFATIVGGAAWTLIAHRQHRSLVWPVACTLLVVAVQLSRVLLFGLPGQPRVMYHANESTEVAIVPWLISGELTYLWQPEHGTGNSQPDSMTASVDLDGSGASPYPMFRVTDRVEHANVCRRLIGRTRQRIREAVESGSIPRFITMLPLREWDCSAGTVWRVLRR
jgi:hypothetical protein